MRSADGNKRWAFYRRASGGLGSPLDQFLCQLEASRRVFPLLGPVVGQAESVGRRGASGQVLFRSVKE